MATNGAGKSGKCVILVDNSNVFIGGQQYSAKQKGLTENGSGNGSGNGNGYGRAPIDRSWRLDFDGLMTALAKGREVFCAIMVGSAVEDNPEPWDAARAAGFEVIVYERKAHGEKCVDTELAVRGAEIIASAEEPMTLVIVSGDRDLLPLVESAQSHGWDVEMCAFRDSYPSNGDMAHLVDCVRPLDDVFAKIGFNQ